MKVVYYLCVCTCGFLLRLHTENILPCFVVFNDKDRFAGKSSLLNSKYVVLYWPLIKLILDGKSRGIMELNKIEFIAMNNPVRRLVQKHIEFKRFEKYIVKHNVTLCDSTILDAGCGSGFSSKIIAKRFCPKELIAFDYMPEQIQLAKKRNPYAEYYVDDITAIQQSAEKFDAAFVFGILHHVPGWRTALDELYRVIKDGGYLFIFEVNDKGVLFVDKYLGFHHPPEARFSWEQFVKALIDSGFIIEEQSRLVFKNLRAYVCRKN